MAHGRALVHDLHVGRLGLRDELRRIAARGLENLYFAVNDRVEVGAIGRWFGRGENGEVHTKGSVGQFTASPDLLAQRFGRRLRQRGQHAEPTSVGDCCHQLCSSYPLHTSLDDWIAHAEKVRDSSPHRLSQPLNQGKKGGRFDALSVKVGCRFSRKANTPSLPSRMLVWNMARDSTRWASIGW